MSSHQHYMISLPSHRGYYHATPSPSSPLRFSLSSVRSLYIMLLSFLFLHRVLELDRGILELSLFHTFYMSCTYTFVTTWGDFLPCRGILIFVFPFALLCSRKIWGMKSVCDHKSWVSSSSSLICSPSPHPHHLTHFNTFSSLRSSIATPRSDLDLGFFSRLLVCNLEGDDQIIDH